MYQAAGFKFYAVGAVYSRIFSKKPRIRVKNALLDINFFFPNETIFLDYFGNLYIL